jgi:hypothetical protein
MLALKLAVEKAENMAQQAKKVLLSLDSEPCLVLLRIKKYKKNPLRAASLWAFRRSTAFKGSRKCASHTPSQIPSFNFYRTKRGLQVGDILGQWLLNVTHTKPCCASWQRRMSPWAWNLRGSWQAP